MRKHLTDERLRSALILRTNSSQRIITEIPSWDS